MSLIWSDNWKRWPLWNIRPDGNMFSKETGDKHTTTNCLHVQTSVRIRHLWALTCSCICLNMGLTLLRYEKRYMRVGMILKMSSVLISIGRIRWKMSMIWSDNWDNNNNNWYLNRVTPSVTRLVSTGALYNKIKESKINYINTHINKGRCVFSWRGGRAGASGEGHQWKWAPRGEGHTLFFSYSRGGSHLFQNF